MDKKCFIIMPISTPEEWSSKYLKDEHHFKHVLEHLLKPSIKKAGLKPITPIAKGSELIHAEIIRNIETADLVLCDMSILNPNVFFELGIRTALNKPVCLVKDDLTMKIPFDTAIVNNHTYLNALQPWTLDKEIEKLANHIKESMDGSNEINNLWNYFSLSSTAHPVKPEKGVDGRIDYLTMQIEALRDQLKYSEQNKKIVINDVVENNYQNIGHKFFDLSSKHGDKIISISYDDNVSIIIVEANTPKVFIEKVQKLADFYNMNYEIRYLNDKIHESL